MLRMICSSSVGVLRYLLQSGLAKAAASMMFGLELHNECVRQLINPY